MSLVLVSSFLVLMVPVRQFFVLLANSPLLGMACVQSPSSLAGRGSFFNVLPAPPGFASRVEHEA
jgi:hypothetical protein